MRMSVRGARLSFIANADQFKHSFREEAREILVDLESALLELNENRGDLELVGRVFRALHTIKGSGAMFGFEDLAAFTHNLETAFDEVRNGRLQISSELIDLTLSALDQIRAMLEEGTAGAAEADPAACAEILARVRHLTGKPERQPAKEAAPCKADAETASGAAKGEMREWAIRFAPGPDFMLNGANPLLLLRELGQLGELSVTAEHGGGSATERTRPGALLRELGDGAGDQRRNGMRFAMYSSLSRTPAS